MKINTRKVPSRWHRLKSYFIASQNIRGFMLHGSMGCIKWILKQGLSQKNSLVKVLKNM